MNTNRLFIAIKVPDEELPTWKPAQIRLKKEIKQHEYEVKWTPHENYHITLQFLGDQSLDKIPLLEKIISDLGKKYSPFQLNISGLDAFADLLHARVLYLGVQNKKILRFMQDELSEILSANGFHGDNKEFVPHMSVLRFRNPHAVKNLISPFQRKSWGKVEVNEFILYKSELKGLYPVYTPLFSAKLEAPPITDLDSEI